MGEASKATKGFVGVFGFLALGTCGMIASGPEHPTNAPEIAQPAIDKPSAPPSEAATVGKKRKTVNVADLPPMDDADKAIGAVINLNGHLCARPIEVKEAGTGLYGVRCITRRDGTGISDYLVNSRTNEVEAI